MLKKHPYLFKYLTHSERNNIDLAEFAIAIGTFIQYTNFKNTDYMLSLFAVMNNPNAFYYLCEAFQEDEFIRTKANKFTPDYMKTPRLLSKTFKKIYLQNHEFSIHI